MQQSQDPDKGEEASPVSSYYSLCMIFAILGALIAIALVLPHMIEFIYEQIRNVSIKTHSALRYP